MLTLHYVLPSGHVIMAKSNIDPSESWLWDWINNLIRGQDDIIFFFTTETTDIGEVV